MSVEKLSDSSKTLIERNPYVQVLQEIVEHIKDNDAFRIYVYSAAKSRDWKVIKEYAQKVCGIGERKAKQCWSYLARCGLIEYKVTKDENNRIIKHDIAILNGSKFNKDEPFINTEKLSTVHRCKNAPGGKPTRVEMSALLKKDIYETKKELQKSGSTDQKENKTPRGTSWKRKEPPKLPDKVQSTYIERNTLSDEFKNAKRGSAKVAKHYLNAMLTNIRPPKCHSNASNLNYGKRSELPRAK